MMEYLKYRIEIPLTLLIFAFTFSDSVVTNWLMYKTCYVSLGLNKSECALLGSDHPDNMTAKIEEQVQPHVTVLAMTKFVIEALGSLTVCFFLGPWSDKYGRKPVLLLSFGGYTLAYAILAFISAFPNLSPWFFLLYALPLCFSGGITTLLASILCYLTDITSTDERGLRMAIFYGVVTSGALIASLTSSFALKAVGYFVMFLITTGVVFLAWLYVLLIITESLPHPETEDRFRNLFRVSLVKESVIVTFKRRENYNRAVLFCLIALCIAQVVTFGADGISYLYLVKNFNWDLKKYTLYSSAGSVVDAVGSIMCIFFLHKVLGINESIILLFSLSTSCLGSVLFGFATSDWHIYLAAAIRSFKGSTSPMARSLISKIVAEDCGKVYSFMGLCETIVALIGSSLYTYVYNSTLSTFPGAFCLVTAAICLYEALMAAGVYLLQRKQHRENYALLREDPIVT